MLKPHRRDTPDAIWHVTGRVNWQVFHLQAERAYHTFLRNLGLMLDRFWLDLLAFVVMSNHYHFVVRSPSEPRYREFTMRRTKNRHWRPYPSRHYKSGVISQFLHDLALAVSKECQDALGLVGHFWDGEHDRRRVLNARSLLFRIAYDHRNPVREGMVGMPEAYPRSSAAWWAGQPDTPIPLVTRPLPFGLEMEAFRRLLLEYQSSRLVDDLMHAFAKSRRRFDSPAGAAHFDRLLREAGLDPFPDCASDGARFLA